MRYAIIAILVYLAVALQTVFADVIQIGRIAPQIPVLVAVAVLLLHRGNGALLIVAAVGLLEDTLWPGRLGIAMTWYLLLGWGLVEVAERFDLRPLGRRVAASGAFACLLALGVGATRSVLGEATAGLAWIAASAAAIGLYTAAAAVLFWFVLGWAESAYCRRRAHYQI